ncbi:MAG: hypothetical protein ABIF01_03625 [Candidatus Micrarchaeota archaeon]
MRRGLVWGLLALLLVSGLSFASFGQGGHGNQTLVRLSVYRESTGNILRGSLYYLDYGATVTDQWQPDVIENDPNSIMNSGIIRAMGPLAGREVELGFIDNSGNYVIIDTVITDAEGAFSYPLSIITFSPTFRCTNVSANFTGDYVNPKQVGEILYCDAYEYGIMLAGVDWNSCVPVFLIFGLLAGAMYASGSDPLRAFDISTPRLPQPKHKPMAGESRFMPGWKNQRLMQLRAMKNSELGVRNKLAELERHMFKLRDADVPESLRKFVNDYRGSERIGLLAGIRNARGLSWAQRSLLIEMLALGMSNRAIKAVSGKNREELRAILANGGNSARIRELKRTMDENQVKKEIGEVKAEMRRKVANYEAEVKKLTESQLRENVEARKAIESISWLSGSGDPSKGGMDWPYKPGVREYNEQATQSFHVARRWAVLGSSKYASASAQDRRKMPVRGALDKVGEFIAKTPGLRGEFAHVITSVGVSAKLHYGMAKGLISQKSRDSGRVGTAGNGFEMMSQELRAVAAQLRRTFKLDENGNRIRKPNGDFEYVLEEKEKIRFLTDSTNLLNSAERIRTDKSLSDVEKIARMKPIQAEYRKLVDEMQGHVDQAKAQQEKSEQDGIRYGNLTQEINDRMKKKLGYAENFRELDTIERKGDMREWAEQANVKIGSWVGGAGEVLGRRGGAYSKGNLGTIAGALGVNAISDTLPIAREGLREHRVRAQKALEILRGSTDPAGKAVIAQLNRHLRVMDEIEANVEKFESDIAKEGKGIEGFEAKGYIDRQAISMLNKWLDLTQGKNKITLSRQEVEEMRKFSEKLASEEGSVMMQRRLRGGTIIEHYGKRRLEGRIEGMLKSSDGKIKVENLVRNAAGARGDPVMGGSDIQGQHFSSMVKIDPKDRMQYTQLQDRITAIMNSADSDKVKAQNIAGLMVEAMPWYRKKQQEYAETIIRALAMDSRAAVRGDSLFKEPGAPSVNEGVEDRNFLSININEGERRLRAQLASNEETLERGYVPGGAITHERALKSGAWIQKPEGYWMAATATDPGPNATEEQKRAYQTRKKEMLDFIQKKIAGADRIVYGVYDTTTGGIRDSENRNERSPYWERAVLGGLFDVGYSSLPVRSNITQAWQTAGYLRARYEGQEMRRADGTPFTVGDLKSEYYSTVFGIRKLQTDTEFEINNLKEQRKAASTDDEKRRISDDIARVKQEAKEREKGMRAEERRMKGELRALAFEPTTVDVWNKIIHKSGTSAAHGGTTHVGEEAGLLERMDARMRGMYSGSVDPNYLDHGMAGLSKRFGMEAYGQMFLGIIGVRSGRAMSSMYDAQGYIATGQAIWGNAVMEPRRHNWVDMEWTEADVAAAMFPGAGFQEKIPIVRSLTYGNFLRAMATPSLLINQPIAAAMRESNIADIGIPGPWEPQYQYRYQHGIRRALNTGIQGVLSLMPAPLNFFGGPNITNNPARNTMLERSALGKALHLSDLKYGVYNMYSRVGPNYALEGKTDKESFSVGGPIYRMGNIDQYYTADYGGPYPPMIYMSPFMKRRSFPSWVANMNANYPGMVGGHYDMTQPEIFRRETQPREYFAMRSGYDAMPKSQQWMRAARLTTPGFAIDWARNKIASHSMRVAPPDSPIIREAMRRDAEDQRRRYGDIERQVQKDQAARGPKKIKKPGDK